MAEYKRGGTASMIVSSVCNEHRNSDLLASDGRVLRAFNDHLKEIRDEFEDIRRAALKLAEYALAARCSNTPEYMQGLALKINAVAKALGEPERAQFDGRDGFRLCSGRQERHRNVPKGGHDAK